MSHPSLNLKDFQKEESCSLWMEEKMPSFPPLQQDLTIDVCIIGGGIVGLTSAYLLTQQGQSVVVLDRGPLGGGQTPRTTGHLAWALDDHFFELERLFGTEGSALAAKSHYQAIKTIEKIIEKEKIDCDFEWLDAYLFLAPGDPPDLLDKEFEAVKRSGKTIEKVERAPFPTFDTGPCLQFPRQAQIHILKYLKGLIHAIEQHHGKLFAYTSVESIEEGTPCLVRTQTHVVKAKNVIVATNTPINDRFMMHTKQAAYRTYVIAGLVPKGSIPHGLYYDTPDPYHYIRLQKTKDDPEKEWLIVGGEDHKTGQEKEILEKYDLLEKWTRERFPMLEKIQYRWSGQIIEPVDCLAFIGRNPHDEHIFIATGDSGNGLTHGTIAGLILTGLITEGLHPWETLYDPKRKNLKAVGEFTKENLNVAAQYSDWVTLGQVKTVEQIRPGKGAVIRKGMNKYAIYRDEKGQLHCYSAVCPHLGCIVKWNEGEKTWDCPCHGSRFDTHGDVINGPANRNLTPCKKDFKE